MNLRDSVGESSSSRQEDGDVPSAIERPLKKARFAWQVKGKYHLKNDLPEGPNNIGQANEPGKSSSTFETKNHCCNNDIVGKTEENLEILGDYLLKQDFNTLDSVISDSDNSQLKSNPNLNTNKLPYPRYVSTAEINNHRGLKSPVSLAAEFSEDDMVSLSMVMTRAYLEDQCIARWQAKQMAKGFVDNTINRVLESWMVAPLPAEIESNRFLALNVADFINNFPGDNSIENEGILMAISAHGLHNTSSSSSGSNNDALNLDSPSSSCLRIRDNNDFFFSLPNSPLPADEESNGIQQTQTDTKESFNELESTWSSENARNSNDFNLPPLFPDTSSSSYHCFNKNDYQSDDIECNEVENIMKSSDEDSINNHFDFMDAAVSFAIQNKGLTSFGADYG